WALTMFSSPASGVTCEMENGDGEIFTPPRQRASEVDEATLGFARRCSEFTASRIERYGPCGCVCDAPLRYTKKLPRNSRTKPSVSAPSLSFHSASCLSIFIVPPEMPRPPPKGEGQLRG